MSATDDNMRSSISSVYADLLSKRKIKEEAKKEQKRMDDELKAQKEAEKKEEEPKLTKKEKREKELDNWKEIVVGLTGDDIEYSPKKKKKKKYRKWIDDDDFNLGIEKKPKKTKKRNYNKEFEPELNMLRTLVTEQNRYTADLQKRFVNAAGPANKDAQAPNKAMVDLASAIMSGRANSLGMLREIGTIKKTIAELYMKQKKLDSDLGKGGGDFDSTDVGLLGSSIASSMFGNNLQPTQQDVGQPTPVPAPDYSLMNNPVQASSVAPVAQATPVQASPTQVSSVIQDFDPSTWQGVTDASEYSKYENIPHTVVVEKNRETGDMRFKAIRNDNGQELVGCPVPTSDPKYLKVNEDTNTVKGEFDEVYSLVYA